MRFLMNMWSVTLTWRAQDMPEHGSVLWQLANALKPSKAHSERTYPDVKIVEAEVFISRSSAAELRDGLELLYDFLAADHADEHYEYVRSMDVHFRLQSAPRAFTAVKDAERAGMILDDLLPHLTDNCWKPL